MRSGSNSTLRSILLARKECPTSTLARLYTKAWYSPAPGVGISRSDADLSSKLIRDMINASPNKDSDPSELRIAFYALRQLGVKHWEDGDVSSISRLSPTNAASKCSLFVGACFEHWGGMLFPRNRRSNWLSTSPVLANQLADPSITFSELTDGACYAATPVGSIVAFYAEGGANASVHSSISLGGNIMIYQNAGGISLGTINQNLKDHEYFNVRRGRYFGH